MTRPNTQRNLIAASAFGVVTAIIMFAQAGQASAATSVLSCEGSNRRAVLECCEERVNKHGLPLWMRQVGAHCSTLKIQKMVKCGPNSHSKKCKLVLRKIEPDGGKKDQTKDSGKNTRGNGRNGGKGNP